MQGFDDTADAARYREGVHAPADGKAVPMMVFGIVAVSLLILVVMAGGMRDFVSA